MTRAVATEKGLGIEYDDTTVCDVCRDVSCSCFHATPNLISSDSLTGKIPMK